MFTYLLQEKSGLFTTQGTTITSSLQLPITPLVSITSTRPFYTSLCFFLANIMHRFPSKQYDSHRPIPSPCLHTPCTPELCTFSTPNFLQFMNNSGICEVGEATRLLKPTVHSSVYELQAHSQLCKFQLCCLSQTAFHLPKIVKKNKRSRRYIFYPCHVIIFLVPIFLSFFIFSMKGVRGRRKVRSKTQIMRKYQIKLLV